jgi:MFS transporter, putative metabolite transport protein
MNPNPSSDKTVGGLIDAAELRPTHWRIWLLSAMGVFLDGFDLFIVAVAMPLIVTSLSPSPAMQGLIGASAVLGAIVGASVLGHLTDRWGRKYLYLADLSIFIVFAVLSGCAWDTYSLIAFRFLLGIGVGADYPICASYVTEFMPARLRGRMLVGAFSFQALGMFGAAVTGLLLLNVFPSQDCWRLMLVAGAIPAGIVLVFRISVPESARWCLRQGKITEAVKILNEVIPGKEKEIAAAAAIEHRELSSTQETVSYWALFSPRYIRRTVLASVPWFLMDIATYGVGLFTPLLLATVAFGTSHKGTLAVEYLAIEQAAFVDLFLILGFVINILLVDKWGRIKLQVLGFAGMALGLIVLAAAELLPGASAIHVPSVLVGFTLFNLLMNMGPNATTFLLPAELFPTEVRASGHGLSAGFAKLGGALGAFFLATLEVRVGSTSDDSDHGVCISARPHHYIGLQGGNERAIPRGPGRVENKEARIRLIVVLESNQENGFVLLLSPIEIAKYNVRLIPNAYAAMFGALLIRRSRESGNPGNPAERETGFVLPQE